MILSLLNIIWLSVNNISYLNLCVLLEPGKIDKTLRQVNTFLVSEKPFYYFWPNGIDHIHNITLSHLNTFFIQNSVLSITGHSGQCVMTCSEHPSWRPLVGSQGDKVIFTLCGERKNITKTSQTFLLGPSPWSLKTCHISTIGWFSISFLCLCV